MILVKKLKVFHPLCLSKIDRENVFADVPNIKEAFKDYNNHCVRKAQNSNFSKGVSPSFSLKIEIYSALIFMQNGLRKSIGERSS